MVISLDLVAGILGFIFTLLIFSYLLGDNPLFRVAIYIFICVSSGYIAAVALWQVIIPRLLYPLYFAITSGDMVTTVVLAVPLLAGVLLLLFPRQSGLG